MTSAVRGFGATELLSETRPVKRLLETRWLRVSELLLLVYFFYAAGFSIRNSTSFAQWALRNALIVSIAALILILAWVEARTGSLIVSCVRDWLPAALILVCYWAVDWFPQPAVRTRFDLAWIGLDRVLLGSWGVKTAIESLGPVFPCLLEFCYCLLYAVVPFSVALLYVCRRRWRVDLFLSTLLLGTLTTYALLPHFPSMGPRVAFPGEDLPGYVTRFRLLNLWLLDHCDIHSSVFPSGHVTLGFSAAFAMLLALPERRYLGASLLALAAGVLVATVYGRYHYAVDGLAGLCVSVVVLAAGIWYQRNRQTL